MTTTQSHPCKEIQRKKTHLNPEWAADKSKTKEPRGSWHLLAGRIKKWSICGVGDGSCFFFFLFFFLATCRPLTLPPVGFRKSLNEACSHYDLWQLIALISLKLTAKTKLDSWAALCAQCSWQVLIRATLFSTVNPFLSPFILFLS